jgi:hypothetical protein
MDRAGGVMSQRPLSRRPSKTIDQLLEEQLVSPVLDNLVEQECDRTLLLTYLDLIREVPPLVYDARYWTEKKRRELRDLLPQVERLAGKIEKINRGPFRFQLVADPTSASLLAVHVAMRLWGRALDFAVGDSSRRRQVNRQVFVAAIAYHVRQRTGHWHHEKVSALIDAVSDGDYSTASHRQWHTKHYDRVVKHLDRSLSRSEDESLGAQLRFEHGVNEVLLTRLIALQEENRLLKASQRPLIGMPPPGIQQS